MTQALWLCFLLQQINLCRSPEYNNSTGINVEEVFREQMEELWGKQAFQKFKMVRGSVQELWTLLYYEGVTISSDK